MKKRVVSTLLASAMIMSTLTACGGGQAAETTAAPAAAPAATEAANREIDNFAKKGMREM